MNFYLIDLVDRVYLQTTDIFYLLFGVKFLNLGLRKGDKEVNRRL